MSTERTMGEVADRAEARMLSAFRYAFVALGINIMVRTPVDTGTLRASWTPRINGIDRSNSGGSLSATAARLQLGDSVTYVNAQAYMYGIEYLRRSDQAPQGVVRLSVIEFPHLISEGIRLAR